jgi:cytohesin
MGRKKFNVDPQKGLQYLYDSGALEEEPQAVAEFLFHCQGLRKTAIGDFLGERLPFNLAVLENFLKLHDFAGLMIVQALRQFLWSFRLPGESQKIDRIMEHFAQRYCAQNPEVFEQTDTCYVLSYAIIMLNTSLHNPNVKDKMTVDDLHRMTSSMAVPSTLVTTIFDSIKAEPFQIPQDGNETMATLFHPDKEGWLAKQGMRYKNWNRRWFVLSDKCLYYFEFSTDKEPRGIIPLENVRAHVVEDKSRPYSFEIYSNTSDVIKACKTDSDGRLVEGKHTTYRMAASCAEEMNSWINAIQRSINHDQFYEMLQARRKRMSAGTSDPVLNRSY